MSLQSAAKFINELDKFVADFAVNNDITITEFSSILIGTAISAMTCSGMSNDIIKERVLMALGFVCANNTTTPEDAKDAALNYAAKELAKLAANKGKGQPS